jgi:hypothetical protein
MEHYHSRLPLYVQKYIGKYMKYNEESDKYLNTLYRSVGAKTWKQKYNTLILKFRIEDGSQSFSHNPTPKQKVGMMEYELLERMDLIQLTYV